MTVDTGNGTPTLKLEVGEETRQASYASGSGTATLVFSYTVVADDVDADGVSVPEDPVSLNRGRIGDADGGATLTYAGLAADAARRVDAVAPKITGASVEATGSIQDGSFAKGETIRIAVQFSEAVYVSGDAVLRMDDGINSLHRDLAYAGKDGDSRLLFDYLVQAADDGTWSVKKVRNPVVRGATVVDGAGNAAVLNWEKDAAGAVVGVDGGQTGADTVGPVVQGIAFSGAAPRDADGNGENETYWGGDKIEVGVTFSEAVTVATPEEGTPPSIGLLVGTATRQAAYASGTGTAVLTFSYTVAPGDADGDGVSVPAGTIAPGGGTLKDAANNDAGLVHDAIAPDAMRRVEWTPVRVTGLAFAGTAPHDADGDGDADTYRTGDTVEVAVTFSEAVTVETAGGIPWLGLLVGTKTGQAAYASGSGTQTLVFSYAVAPGDEDTDGVSVPAGTIALNGGTLEDAAEHGANLAHAAIAADPARQVDGSTVPARLTGVAFAGEAPRDTDRDGAGDTYRPGDEIRIEARFDRSVTVDTAGTPSLTLLVGENEREASYVSGSGTATLVFSYEVAAGEEDTDGVSVPADPVEPGGARIGDAAGTATLTHGGVAAQALHKVDGVAARMTGASRNAGSLLDGAFGAGEAVRVSMRFSEPVFVSGTPLPLLVFGVAPSGLVRAPPVGRNAAGEQDVLVFEHVVQAADEGIATIWAQALSMHPDGGLVKDAAGNPGGAHVRGHRVGIVHAAGQRDRGRGQVGSGARGRGVRGCCAARTRTPTMHRTRTAGTTRFGWR